MTTSTKPAFCNYVAPVFDPLDAVELEAHHQAQRLTHHINEALQAALHIDEYQTVYSDVPGTAGEDPFDVLRAAINDAEKNAAKGY